MKRRMDMARREIAVKIKAALGSFNSEYAKALKNEIAKVEDLSSSLALSSLEQLAIAADDAPVVDFDAITKKGREFLLAECPTKFEEFGGGALLGGAAGYGVGRAVEKIPIVQSLIDSKFGEGAHKMAPAVGAVAGGLSGALATRFNKYARHYLDGLIRKICPYERYDIMKHISGGILNKGLTPNSLRCEALVLAALGIPLKKAYDMIG
jgi:hypothetical protein